MWYQILEFDTPHDILIRTLNLTSILASNIAPFRSLEVKNRKYYVSVRLLLGAGPLDRSGPPAAPSPSRLEEASDFADDLIVLFFCHDPQFEPPNTFRSHLDLTF